jgi:predicted Zn-dependent peptidase
VGDLQPRRALGLAEEAMASWTTPGAPGTADLPPVPAPRPGPIELVARPSSVQSNLRIGGKFAVLGEPDWPAASLAEQIFGGMFSSRIVANLRERNGYGYSPRSAVRHGRAGSSFTLAADVATAVTGPALVEILYELGRVATLGINDEELELARRHSVGRFSFEIASLPGLATTLANLAIRGVDLGYLTGYPKAVIATTKDQVDQAARRYLAPAGLVMVVVGDPDAVTGPLSALGEVKL